MIIKNILRHFLSHFFVSRFLLIKKPPKNPFFARAQKNPHLLALANPHAHKPARAQTPLNSVPGVWGFRDVIVTIRLSDWSICTT